MGICKDCIYWDKALGHKNWNTCNLPDWVEYNEKIGDDEIAYYADAHDDSGLDAGIKTGPMFGCIKFEEK